MRSPNGKSRRAFTRSSNRPRISLAEAGEELGIRKSAAVREYLKKYLPEALIELLGRHHDKVDAELLRRHLDKRRWAELERRKEVDEDWIKMRLEERFG